MKIYLDKNYLQRITKGDHEFIVSEEQKNEIERILGMLKHEIRFCGLITGYRGTGKSTFAKEIKKKLEGSDKMVIVSFNAANYSNYDVFIKRFVRELYFKLKEKNKPSKQLEKMYYHTFFDIKETYINNSHMLEKEIAEKEKENQLQLSENINIIKGIKIVLYILLGIVVGNAVDFIVVKSIAAILVVLNIVGQFVDINLFKSIIYSKKNLENKEDVKKNEYNKLAETLYDNEIAEYYVYDEIKTIAERLSLVVILDELDKVEDKELDMIFHDLKPLLLSENCNFILIAGRNMEKYLQTKQQDVDSIATNIFSNRIYMSLSTVQEMKEFAKQFLKKEENSDSWNGFDADGSVQNYFKLKIFEAKGVKRAFVNKILSGLKWENDEPYIDEASTESVKEFSLLFDVLEKMEDYVCQNYIREKRDEILQNVYYWIEKIQKKKHTVFSLEDIVGKKSQIEESAFFSNVAEHMSLVQILVTYMIEKQILEAVEDDYKWCADILINREFTRVDLTNEADEEFEILKGYIEIFLEKWDEIDMVLSCFAKYNGLSLEIEEQYLRIFSLLNAMLPDFNTKDSYLNDALDYLEDVREIGIGMEDIEDIQKYSAELSIKREQLLAKLLEYTYKNKLGIEELQVGRTINTFDVVYTEEFTNKEIYIEIKYYKEYLKLINNALLHDLTRKIGNYRILRNVDSYALKVVVFTDIVDEEGLMRFNEKCSRMINHFTPGSDVQVLLIPFNDYEMFTVQMDNLIR